MEHLVVACMPSVRTHAPFSCLGGIVTPACITDSQLLAAKRCVCVCGCARLQLRLLPVVLAHRHNGFEGTLPRRSSLQGRRFPNVHASLWSPFWNQVALSQIQETFGLPTKYPQNRHPPSRDPSLTYPPLQASLMLRGRAMPGIQTSESCGAGQPRGAHTSR